MTDVVIPSVDRPVSASGAAVANRFGGDSFIAPTTTRLLELPEAGLDTGALNSFRLLETTDSRSDSSNSDFSVSIDSGEALIGGRYCARDSQSTAGFDFDGVSPVSIVLSVPVNQTDSLQLARARDVSRRNRRIPLLKVRDDDSLSTVDARQVGARVTDAQIETDISLSGSATEDFTVASETLVTVSWDESFISPPVVQATVENRTGPAGLVFATLTDVSTLSADIKLLNQNSDPLTVDLHVTARGRGRPEVTL